MVSTHVDCPLAPYAERELLERYNLATADHVRRGRDWYCAARREVRKIARETGVTVAQAAAVLAITSPDSQLIQNVQWARAACANGGQTAGRYPGDQLPKIRAALASKRPGQYVTGPKVSAFYRAIMGDGDVLVIDRWAAFAAGSTKDKVPGARAKRAIAEAYHTAAAKVGETVRDFQAIVWIQARETTPAVTGTVRRYTDITA